MGMARAESKNVQPAVSRLPKPRRDACRRENSETQDRTGDLQIFSLTLSQVSSRGLALASARGRELELIQFFSERARQGASFSGLSAGYIAQWSERLTADQQVPGSNPGVPFQFVWPHTVAVHWTSQPCCHIHSTRRGQSCRGAIDW